MAEKSKSKKDIIGVLKSLPCMSDVEQSLENADYQSLTIVVSKTTGEAEYLSGTLPLTSAAAILARRIKAEGGGSHTVAAPLPPQGVTFPPFQIDGKEVSFDKMCRSEFEDLFIKHARQIKKLMKWSFQKDNPWWRSFTFCPADLTPTAKVRDCLCLFMHYVIFKSLLLLEYLEIWCSMDTEEAINDNGADSPVVQLHHMLRLGTRAQRDRSKDSMDLVQLFASSDRGNCFIHIIV